MRVMLLGAFAGLCLMLAVWGGASRPTALAQAPVNAPPDRFGPRHPLVQNVAATQPAQLVQSGDLLALSSDASDGVQQITLIDPKTQVMSVYHVERATGKVSLRSVRNIRWDLQMDEFNSVSPSPREIRSLLQQR